MYVGKRIGTKSKATAIGLLTINLLLAGCQSIEHSLSISPAVPLVGAVHGGNQPVSGAKLQLYAAGTTGQGSAALPLLKEPVTTGSDGSYSINGDYTCPSADSELYLTATGGVPLPGGKDNPSLSLMTMLGPCGTLTSSSQFEINEVTTVGATSAMASYMSSMTSLGSAAGDPAFLGQVTREGQFVNNATGTSPGAVPAGFQFPASELYALADILATCVNSSGGTAGDGTPCGNLFQAVRPSNSGPPTNTVDAALAIARTPDFNVDQIFALLATPRPFSPTITIAPATWKLALIQEPATPVISPAAGTYAAGQQVTLNTSTSGATIYYTTDGSQPTTSSPVYSAPLKLTGSETINAISADFGLVSSVASTKYTVTTSHLVFATQPSTSFVSTALSPAPVVEVIDNLSGKLVTSATAPVTVVLSANPGNASLLGSTSVVPVNGIATFPNLSLTAPASGYRLQATSANMPPVVSNSFDISNGRLGMHVPKPSILVGSGSTGSVTIPAPVPSPTTINLSSSSPSLVSVTPSSVIIPAGSTSGSFSYEAMAPGTATINSTSTNYTSGWVQVTAMPDPVITVSVSNAAPMVGMTLTGTVTFSAPATSAVSVALSSSSPTILSIAPATINIPAGASSGSFTYRALTSGSSTLTASAPPYTAGSIVVTTKAIVVNASSVPVIPSTLFGLTVLNFYNLTPTMSFGTTRTWDSYPNLDWSDVNPSSGVYQFQWLDHFIALNQARGTDIIYTLGRTPHWASSQPNNTASSYGPGECAPPSDMSYYDAYLTALVTHEKGLIKYYELWNEPDATPMYCGTIQQMITMAQHASQIIKSIDPNAQILSPGVTGGPGPAWLSSFLAGGGSSYVDGIAFHGYWSTSAEDTITVVNSYKTVMATNGVASLPMYDTEASWADFGMETNPPMTLQVSYIAKDYLLHWSAGISSFVWYAYDGGSTWGGMLDSTGKETAAAVSYKQVYLWMVGASMPTPCTQASNHVYTCGLTRSGGYSAQAVWIPNSTATYTVPAGFTQYQDLAGVIHPITGKTVAIQDQPILLETGNIP